MSNSGSNAGDIFDVRKIRRLVELMNEHELSEIDLRDQNVRIRLRKHQEPIIAGMSPAPMMQYREPPPTLERKAASNEGGAPKEEHLAIIKSPMVGTFFAAPNPESPPYVKVGDHVGPTTTVCIIEAMKVFNEIAAEVSGKVVAVLVQAGEPV